MTRGLACFGMDVAMFMILDDFSAFLKDVVKACNCGEKVGPITLERG